MVTSDSDEVLLAVARDLIRLRDKLKEWKLLCYMDHGKYLVAKAACEDLTEILHQYGME